MKLNTLMFCTSLVLLTGYSNGATILGNLGLLNPTGSATNGNLTRQYTSSFVGAGDALGATIDLTFTLTFSANSGANLSNTFGDGGIFFRKPATSNVGSGQSFTITIDSISINSGWTITAGGKTDSVTVASEGNRITRFSVNGGATFDYTGTGATGANTSVTFTNSNFSAFDSVGDTLSFLNVDQTLVGGQNMRNVAFSFEVVPEPSSALLGSIGLLALLRRRRA